MSIIKNKQRHYISTYLDKREYSQFETVLCELGISKAALAKGLIRKALSTIKNSKPSSKQALELIKLGKLD